MMMLVVILVNVVLRVRVQCLAFFVGKLVMTKKDPSVFELDANFVVLFLI